jgi:aspartate aminotransferase-like enzyme
VNYREKAEHVEAEFHTRPFDRVSAIERALREAAAEALETFWRSDQPWADMRVEAQRIREGRG